MLAMMAVIVDYMFKMCFELFIFYKRSPPNVTGPRVTYPRVSLSRGMGALITR